MSAQYAKDQPAGFTNRIERIAIVGASGHVGSYLAKYLLATGKHTVTALTRADSSGEFAQGVVRKPIDYAQPSTIVEALKGQQVLIITMNASAPKENREALIKSAGEAGVSWVMPNHYGGDLANKVEGEERLLGPETEADMALIEANGMSWVALACNFWYEWSTLLGTPGFGISIDGRKALLYDDGNTKICSSTWDQCGRAVAAVFSLPELPQQPGDKTTTLSEWRNRLLYINSFVVSQRDILASIHRVTGTSDKDFDISENPLPDYYNNSVAQLKSGGGLVNFVRAIYSRGFFKDGSGDFSHKVANDKLGLPKEDLDEATRRLVQWLKEGKAGWKID